MASSLRRTRIQLKLWATNDHLVEEYLISMIKSRFTFWAFLLPVLSIALAVMLCLMIGVHIFATAKYPLLGMGFLYGLLLFILVWLVYGELRTKVISVQVDKKTITVKKYLGLGATKEMQLSEFDGYIIAHLPHEYDTKEYLYLVKGNKKIIKISEFYHRNYSEIKKILARKIKFMGTRPFSYRREMLEIFE